MTISMRTRLAVPGNHGTGIVSLRTVANRMHAGFPITFREILDLLEPITLTSPLNSGTCSGSCEITMSSDGVVHYTGRVHDSGALAARYTAITSFPTLSEHTTYPATVSAQVAALGPVVIGHRGYVGGTFSVDSRDDTWDKTVTDARIANHWPAVKAAVASARTEFGTGTGAIELLDGFVNAATGTFVFSL